jgi:hypothetical protein
MTDHEQVAIEHLDQAESDLVNDQWTPVTNAHIGLGIGHAILALVTEVWALRTDGEEATSDPGGAAEPMWGGFDDLPHLPGGF